MEESLKNIIENLPTGAGAYLFKDANEQVIYVGKAKNLKKRVKNHFQKPDQHAFDFINQVTGIDFIAAASEKDALLLEQQFIKKLQPRWNVEWKDDKNYFYIAITREAFPRVFLTHQPDQRLLKFDFNKLVEIKLQQPQAFGPYVSGREVKSFLCEIRKILPFRTCANVPKKPCMYQALNLCPAPCINKRRKSKYQRIIQTLKVLLRIYQGRVLIPGGRTPAIRIEGYDISNLSGTLAVGSMVVFENGKPNKNQYRKFKIKTIKGQNDMASLREVLRRRLKHDEWPKPDLILLDGGKGQLKACVRLSLTPPILALAKTKQGRLFSPFAKNYADLDKLPQNVRNLLLRLRDESHRFAINYNKLRREEFK